MEERLSRFFTEEYREEETGPEELNGGGRTEDSRYGADVPARAVRPLDSVIITPRSYGDARRAADAMEKGKIVIVVLEESIEDGSAGRFVDFISGAVYLAKGQAKLLEERVLICTPPSVYLETDRLVHLEGVPVWKVSFA